MLMSGICPQCSHELSDNQYINGIAVCSCGWSDSSAALNLAKKTEKHTMKTMIGMAAVLVAMYFHLLNWGSYSVEIPFVKLAEFTGLLSKDGYQELADVCVVLNKWDCAKDALTDIYAAKRDPAGLAARARLETRLGETQNALSSYAAYFAVGGKAIEPTNFYGELLEQAGRSEEALKMYEMSIANSGTMLPIKATGGLIHVLMKQGRYEEALTRIQAFQASADNASGYFNTEKTQLENYLGQQAKSSKGKPARGA